MIAFSYYSKGHYSHIWRYKFIIIMHYVFGRHDGYLYEHKKENAKIYGNRSSIVNNKNMFSGQKLDII